MWGNLSACTKCQIVFRRKIVRQEVSKCRSPLPIPQQGKQAPSSAHCPPPLSPSATRCERRSCQPGRTGCWLDEVSWQLFTILAPKYKYKWQVQVQVQYQYKWSAGSSSQFGLTYKCCLSDSQLIKGGFPPKDFGQCWNFEYLGKVGIEKSNKKPIKKTTQKIAKKSTPNLFCKKNPGQRQQIENQQKQFNLHDIWSLTNLANIYGTTKICNL